MISNYKRGFDRKGKAIMIEDFGFLNKKKKVLPSMVGALVTREVAMENVQVDLGIVNKPKSRVKITNCVLFLRAPAYVGKP